MIKSLIFSNCLLSVSLGSLKTSTLGDNCESDFVSAYNNPFGWNYRILTWLFLPASGKSNSLVSFESDRLITFSESPSSLLIMTANVSACLFKPDNSCDTKVLVYWSRKRIPIKVINTGTNIIK